MLNNFAFSSNTTAGCSNQHYYLSDGAPHTRRAYFKIFAGGRYNYSLVFSGILDGSYRRISFPDEPCGGWTIHSARVGRLSGISDDIFRGDKISQDSLTPPDFTPLTFSGEDCIVAPTELFRTDPISMYFEKGDYLCLEICVSGGRIPCHPECVTPIFDLTDNRLTATTDMPLPCMIGTDRPVKGKIAFLGDSITQGVGTDIGSYKHWVALLSDMLPEDYSPWNLGIGYGKASDVSDFEYWFSKAASCDTVFVCYGVNDINGDTDACELKRRLSTLVDRLNSLGKRIILQTIPPYDYPEARRLVWEEVNRYITDELSKAVLRVFDVREVLSLSASEPHKTRFGGHPNAEGCALWAKKLYECIGDLFPV